RSRVPDARLGGKKRRSAASLTADVRQHRVAALGVTGLLLAGLAGGLPSIGARAAPVPGTSCSVFPANNIWNTDISSMPVNGHSAAWLSSTGAGSGRLLHPGFGGPPYGIPFNVVDSGHATTSYTFQYAS